MKSERLDQLIRHAIKAGTLPAAATCPEQPSHPWPLVLLAALGSWLAAVPLLVLVFLVFGEPLMQGPAVYLIGAAVLLALGGCLRMHRTTLFLEQLMLPMAMVGCGLLAFGLLRDLPARPAMATLAALAVPVAWLLARPWLRVLLGATAAWLTALALPFDADSNFFGDPSGSYWLAWQACLALWLAGHWLRAGLNDGARARVAAALEAFLAGWIVATLLGLAAWAGMPVFLARSSDRFGGAGQGWLDITLLRAVSPALAAGAAIWLGARWPFVRHWLCAGFALLLAGLAWRMPALGATLLALAYCLGSGRPRLAGAAAMAAAWIVGVSYYDLGWPLATKAAVLAGTGAALGVLAWLAWPRALVALAPQSARMPAPAAARTARAGIALCALAVLVLANAGIWQKEQLIAHGQPVYVALASVDPRSLIQGDYMRLRFALPPEDVDGLPERAFWRRPRLVARRDARGIATLLRGDSGAALADGEFLIELTRRHGGWTLVSDAWFFKEGEAGRWAGARYGEFRVGADGRALLVGLRGPGLEKL